MSFLNKVCERTDNDRAYMLLIVGYPADDATIPQHATVKKSLGGHRQLLISYCHAPELVVYCRQLVQERSY